MEVTGKVVQEASVTAELHGSELILLARIGEMSHTIAKVRARYDDNRLVLVVYKDDAKALGIEVVGIGDSATERS